MSSEPWPTETFTFLDNEALLQLSMDAFRALLERLETELVEVTFAAGKEASLR